MRRAVTQEILDSPDCPARDVELALGDLRRVNRYFGGISTSEALFRRVLAKTGLRELSLLDVGSGSGDVPLKVAERLRLAGAEFTITLFDQHESHLPKPDGNPRLHTATGDALRMPFVENWFDVVSSSLFVHHLEPDQVREFAKQALRVTRHAVVINDLVRDPIHLFGIHLWRPMFRTRVSYVDGVASIKRAYRPDEIREMLTGLGSGIEITRHYAYRMGIILWK